MRVKLLRDLLHMKSQAGAIGLVLACGVATFVMSVSMLDSLSTTIDEYYARNRFADIFVHLKRAPNHLAQRFREIPGVSHVQTRVVERVTLDMPDLPEPASGQIVSLPPDPASGLNLLHLRAGRMPQGEHSREVLVSQGFADAHALRPGDAITAVLNGRRESLRISGVALSPEFVYLIAPGGVLPEKKRFGVFWMPIEEMRAAFDMEGAFNDALVSLSPGVDQDAVIGRLDRLTVRYGGLGAYARKDQASNMFVQNELRELRGMSLIVPIIFLAVSAFLLNIVLTRMVETQREQIAALKALGYANPQIARHYLAFVLIIAVLAVIAGVAMGAMMGRGMTALYAEFFDFPVFRYLLRPRVVALGLLVSVISASAGVLSAVRKAVRLPPAEAMRPKAPSSFRPTVLERIGLHAAVPVSLRMVLRQLERQPIRTALSTLGIALATAILVVGSFTQDSIGYLLDFQFNRVQRYDVSIALGEQTDDSALSTIAHLPGVRRVEPYRDLAVKISRDAVERRVGVSGITGADGLHRLLDIRGREVRLPERGVVLSSTLASVLRVRVGDRVRIESLEGRRPVFTTRVTGLIDDFSGLSAYMRLSALNAHMNEPNTIGGAYLAVDADRTNALYDELRDVPAVVSVQSKAATVRNFRETIERNLGIMRPFLVGFSIIIAFGVIYNSARISLSERGRDLATLRVLGFTRAEISAIQLGELAVLTAVAIPTGLVIGHLLARLTADASASELVRIPFVIEPPTYVFAALIVAGAALASALIIRRRLHRIDLISVLKSRE